MPEALDLRHPRTGRPLRVLITRPDEQADETAELVRRAFGEPLRFPCLHRAPPADPHAFLSSLTEPAGYSIVAIASANAAIALAEALPTLPTAASQKLRTALFAAVGPRTAAALVEHGLSAHVVASEDNTGAGLSAAIDSALRERGQTLADQRVLVPRAAVARAALVESLRRAGAAVTEAVAYDMLPASADSLAPLPSLLREGQIDLLPFGSPRTAAIALAALQISDETLLKQVVVGAIGETTESALRKAKIRVDVVADTASFEGLLHEMRDHYVRVHCA